MKTNIFIVTILCIFISSCKSASHKTSQTDEKQQLEGEWVLNYIKYPQQKLQELYSGRIPFIRLDLKQNIVSGNNGCNSFSGKMSVSGNTMNFKGPMTATKMYCEGQGESVFMENLAKTESFSISKDGKTLQITGGGILLMSFVKK